MFSSSILTPQVLSEYTSKKILIKKRKGGAKMPDGPARYLPTSPEFMNILEEREDKQNEKETKAGKKTKTGTHLSMTLQKDKKTKQPNKIGKATLLSRKLSKK